MPIYFTFHCFFAKCLTQLCKDPKNFWCVMKCVKAIRWNLPTFGDRQIVCKITVTHLFWFSMNIAIPKSLHGFELQYNTVGIFIALLFIGNILNRLKIFHLLFA